MNAPVGADVLAAADAADAGQAAPPVAAPVVDGAEPAPGGPAASGGFNAQEWIDAALNMGRAGRELLPAEVRAEWTDERLQAFGVALADCARHYGWTFGGIIGHPVAALVFAGAPLAWPVAKPYLAPHLARLYKRPGAEPGAAPEVKAGPAAGSPGAFPAVN